MVARLLRASLRSIALRWTLAAFLLVAQQGALTHALSHAGEHAHETVVALHGDEYSAVDATSSHHEGDAPVVSGQCAFDLVYSQVLGGLHAGHALFLTATDAISPVVSVAQSFSATTRVPYDTRGPPAIS
jgi:hypothetical protein